MKGRDVRQSKRRSALPVILVLAVAFGAIAILGGRVTVFGRKAQIRDGICFGSTAISCALVVASILLALRQQRVKGVRTVETNLLKGNAAATPSGDTVQTNDDITVMLYEDNDKFEIEYEITFIHTEEYIP